MAKALTLLLTLALAAVAYVLCFTASGFGGLVPAILIALGPIFGYAMRYIEETVS